MGSFQAARPTLKALLLAFVSGIAVGPGRTTEANPLAGIGGNPGGAGRAGGVHTGIIAGIGGCPVIFAAITAAGLAAKAAFTGSRQFAVVGNGL